MNKSNKVFFLFLCFITGFAFAAPEVESVAISGDKLIVTGHKFLDIDGLTLSDPQTGFKKPFKVESATESEIVGTAVDNQKITVASLMNLIIDTAKGETTYPVSFSLQKDAVTNPTIKNGAITPDKFIGVTTANPPDQTVPTWSQATKSFVFNKASTGGGVSEIVLGPGITGAPNTASGSVPVSVDIGQTGDASKTKIPYFSSTNKIVLDSTNSPTGALSGLSFKDETQNFDISNDNGLRIDSNVSSDLLVLDVDGNLALKGPVTVASEFKFSAGTNYVGFKAPASIASNTVWILPAADGSSGTFLTTNGTGTLSWTNPPGASAKTCQSGYNLYSNRLCMSERKGESTSISASQDCGIEGAMVCNLREYGLACATDNTIISTENGDTWTGDSSSGGYRIYLSGSAGCNPTTIPTALGSESRYFRCCYF